MRGSLHLAFSEDYMKFKRKALGIRQYGLESHCEAAEEERGVHKELVSSLGAMCFLSLSPFP